MFKGRKLLTNPKTVLGQQQHIVKIIYLIGSVMLNLTISQKFFMWMIITISQTGDMY